ncbi:hypothetical protein L7F22_002824 [Adiantum nelumboides]|nr:hypothetical protein [Adiantum nelumboides]
MPTAMALLGCTFAFWLIQVSVSYICSKRTASQADDIRRRRSEGGRRRYYTHAHIQAALPSIAAGDCKAASTGIYDVEVVDDCSICLDSFEEGQTVRVLPLCKHAFHSRCIDRWLLTPGHRAPRCPYCRCPIKLGI